MSIPILATALMCSLELLQINKDDEQIKVEGTGYTLFYCLIYLFIR